MKPNPYRLFIAYCIAAASVFFCGSRGHVQIEFSRPATYLSVFEHRCGILMVVCVSWAVVEMVLMAAAPYDWSAQRRRTWL